MGTWLDSITGGRNIETLLYTAGTATGSYGTPVGAALTTAGFVVGEYTKNERKKREALRTGNRKAYEAAVRAGEEILSRADAEERKAAIESAKAEKEALDQWNGFLKLGRQGELDLKQFNANPTAYIKSRTNFDAEVAEMVKAVEKGAAARGDLLGTETIAKEAMGTASLMSAKRMEAMDNINMLLGLGGEANRAQSAIRSDFDRWDRERKAGKQKQADEIAAWLAGQEQLYNNTNQAITAKRYGDANALTMNLINNAANLGLGAATLATGMPRAPVAPVAPADAGSGLYTGTPPSLSSEPMPTGPGLQFDAPTPGDPYSGKWWAK